MPLTGALEESRRASRTESGRRLGAAAISVVAAGMLIHFLLALAGVRALSGGQHKGRRRKRRARRRRGRK